LWSQWQLNLVYTMIDAGVWDDACRRRMKEFLPDSEAGDALTLMFYCDGITTGRDTISKIVGLEEYLGLVDERLASSDMHDSERQALEKAKDPFSGEIAV
jgi:hypothetical protein